MFKRILLVLFALFIFVNVSYADMKYTKITSTDANITESGAPPEIIQGMMANSNKTETIYIKGNNVRIDDARFKTSTITMCDKQQTVHLMHDVKKYVISPFSVSKNSSDKGKPSITNKNKDPKEQFKTNVIDTKKQEMIEQYKTHKYVVDLTMPENDPLFKDMKRTEEIWVSDIKDQMPVCNPDSSQTAMPSGLILKRVITAKDPFSEGKMKSTVLIKDLSTTPISDSTFEIPEGYTKLSP